jgi:hypothetical protein
VRTYANGNNLDADRWPHRHLNEVTELITHGCHSTDPLMQGGLVQDNVQSRPVRFAQQCLPGNPCRHAIFDLLLGKAAVLDHRSGVLKGLQQARYQEWLVVADPGGVLLEVDPFRQVRVQV